MAKKTRKKLRNPFVYDGYEGPDYFCDRTEETEKLISHLKNGRNLTLLQRHRLPGASSVKKSLQLLMEKDIVYHSAEGYMIYDHFFSLWLRRLL